MTAPVWMMPTAVVAVLLSTATGIADQFTRSAVLGWRSLALLMVSVVLAVLIKGMRQARRPGGLT